MQKKTIPMLLTYARIAAIPLLIAVWEVAPAHSWWFVFALFAAASVTDYVDGYLARKWHVTSDLGAMLDQIADKLLVATVLIILAYDHHIPALLAVLIVLRELLVSGVREFAGLKQIPLPVSKGGKAKTALQMAGLSLLLFALAAELLELLVIGHALLALSVVFAWVSAAAYVRGALRQL